MDKNTLSHTTWECKYHIVFAPNFRRQIIYGTIKADVANIWHRISELIRYGMSKSNRALLIGSKKVILFKESFAAGTYRYPHFLKR